MFLGRGIHSNECRSSLLIRYLLTLCTTHSRVWTMCKVGLPCSMVAMAKVTLLKLWSFGHVARGATCTNCVGRHYGATTQQCLESSLVDRQ